LTHTEVKEWDRGQDENDSMKMLTGNESTENVLQGNEDNMESDNEENYVTHVCKEKLVNTRIPSPV
jgi:hypothetical protein